MINNLNQIKYEIHLEAWVISGQQILSLLHALLLIIYLSIVK